MSNYEDIYGKRVKELSADPTLNSSYEGQVWYNSTEGVLKTVATFGSWISGANVINGASSRLGLGTSTAALVCGGADSGGNKANVEEYNGNGYSSGTNMPGDRQDGGSCGTTTASLVWCGEVPGNTNTTIEWDGSSWTSGGVYPLSLRGTKGSGTQTAAISNGGDNGTTANTTTAEYNGNVWQTGEALPVGRIATASSGPQTSALITTGQNARPNPSVSNLNTSYDGASWTIETVYPTSLRQAAGTGTSNSANLVAGGVGATPFGSAVNTAAQWNGSSWTSTQTMVEGVTHGFGAGTSTQSITGSGAKDYPVYPVATQEFNTTINTITAGAFSAGGNLNTARSRNIGGGTQTAAVSAGGFTSPPNTRKSEVEEYNGSSWTEVTDLPTAIDFAGGGGTQTALVMFAGNSGPGVRNGTLEYDGTNWTSGGTMGTARYRIGGAGTQTSALGFGGYTGTAQTGATEEYDGSSWTTGGALSTSRNYMQSNFGSQTNALAVCGGAPYTNQTEEYNGSSWSSGENYLFGNRGYVTGSGPSGSDFRTFGAGVASPSPRKSGESSTYDGTNYTTGPSMSTDRREFGVGAASASNAVIGFGGDTVPGFSSATEEFNAETTAVTAKTLTSS